MVCCNLSRITVAAVVAMLYHHLDLPLPQWPYGLSINMLLSIYVAVLKGAILSMVAEGSWAAQMDPIPPDPSTGRHHKVRYGKPWTSGCTPYFPDYRL